MTPIEIIKCGTCYKRHEDIFEAQACCSKTLDVFICSNCSKVFVVEDSENYLEVEKQANDCCIEK